MIVEVTFLCSLAPVRLSIQEVVATRTRISIRTSCSVQRGITVASIRQLPHTIRTPPAAVISTVTPLGAGSVPFPL